MERSNHVARPSGGPVRHVEEPLDERHIESRAIRRYFDVRRQHSESDATHSYNRAVRVAIDARKLHDFGIGTYIRICCGSSRGSIARRTYVLLSPETDLDIAAQLGTELPDRPRTLRRTIHCASRSKCRWCSARAPDVYHAPHYVLPPAVPLPLRRHDPRLHSPDVSAIPAEQGGLRLRAGVDVGGGEAIHLHPDRVEASKRDILHFFNVAPEKIVVAYNAIDDHFWLTPPEGGSRAGA
jgi:hypothetical protein